MGFKLHGSCLKVACIYAWTLLATLVPMACSAESSTNHTNSATAPGGTNAASAEKPIPLAVFDLTAKSTKDPFFPMSLRQPINAIKSVVPAFSIVNFTLKGLSGGENRRLALINNRTLAAGENTEVTTPAGKIKIYCLNIKESSVVIRAEGQTDLMEIFLRKAAQ